MSEKGLDFGTIKFSEIDKDGDFEISVSGSMYPSDEEITYITRDEALKQSTHPYS
jgi:hypothetical protein